MELWAMAAIGKRCEVRKVRGVTLVSGRRKYASREVSKATDEQRLVARAKSGSSIAFGQLYERHRVMVYRTIFHVVRQKEDAEDAVQRCFQRAFTNLVLSDVNQRNIVLGGRNALSPSSIQTAQPEGYRFR